MILTPPPAFIGINPAITASWIDIAWWVIPIVYAALILWAVVELVRNSSLDIAPKIAFAFLVVLAPFLGALLTILLVRTHARPSNQAPSESTPHAQATPRSPER